MRFYLLAGKADAGGLLCNSNRVFTANDLAWFLRCSPDAISAYLEELCSAGLMAGDGEGYKISRFLEEQGPGDNNKRGDWRIRQNKHRARARGESEKDGEKELAVEAEGEVEEELECHGDNTVTPGNPPPPAASSSDDEEIFQSYWTGWNSRKLGKKKMQEFLAVIHNETGIEDWELRLRDCLSIWHSLCEEHKDKGWQKGNPDAVMELYPIPNLEERMQREGFTWKSPQKERRRKDILRIKGLLGE